MLELTAKEIVEKASDGADEILLIIFDEEDDDAED